MTDEYRCEDYELHAEPVVTETGVARPSETEEFRSSDYDELLATSVSTVKDGSFVEQKAVTPDSKNVETKPVDSSTPAVETK